MTTTTQTLADFLLARVSEDEAMARAAADARSRYGDLPNDAYRELVEMTDSEGCQDEAITHIARHDPARVLAECEAKRAIIRQSTGIAEVARVTGSEDFGGDAILRALAQPYRNHPEFREEWMP